MEIALGVAISQYPKGTFLTATADRVKEFACYTNVEATHDLDVYFADPYSSWQRGSNEARILLGWRTKSLPAHSISPIIDHEYVWDGEPLTNPFQRKCRTWIDNSSLKYKTYLLPELPAKMNLTLIQGNSYLDSSIKLKNSLFSEPPQSICLALFHDKTSNWCKIVLEYSILYVREIHLYYCPTWGRSHQLF